MKLTPWPDLPITIEPNGDDGYTLTRTDTGARKAYAIAKPVAEPPTCAWRADEHDDTWHTDCGQMWQFNDGGPTENKQRFCGYCGGTLVAVPFAYTDEPEPADGPEGRD